MYLYAQCQVSSSVVELWKRKFNNVTVASAVLNVRIVGVQKFDTYSACFKCAAKLNVDEEDVEMGECVKCRMIQCISERCKSVMATLMVKTESGNTHILRVFDKVISDIAEKPGDEISPKALLKARSFGMHFSDGIIRSIRHS